MKIPLMDLSKQTQSIRHEIDSVIKNVIDSGVYVGGPEKDGFELEWAAAVGTKHCIGVGNGTDSLFLILKALGIGAGDEVVTAANSFIASSEAISAAGAKPVFVDVDERTMNIDLTILEQLLAERSYKKGGRIRAIIPVHLYGRLVDMPRLMEIARTHDVHVIEDAAQAHLAIVDGRRSGCWGDAGSFSFYPGKNLGAFGDAGAVVTNDVELAKKIRMLANHGRIGKYDHEFEGFNSRLDPLQAAILRVKLKHLQKWSDSRYEKALIYDRIFKDARISEFGCVTPEIPPRGSHVFHLYVIRVENRDQVQKRLNEKGVSAVIHYPSALPNLPAYSYLGHKKTDFPVATRLSKEVLSLPLFPEITFEEQAYVASSLAESLMA